MMGSYSVLSSVYIKQLLKISHQRAGLIYYFFDMNTNLYTPIFTPEHQHTYIRAMLHVCASPEAISMIYMQSAISVKTDFRIQNISDNSRAI